MKWILMRIVESRSILPVIVFLLIAKIEYALSPGVDTTAFVTSSILSRPTDNSVTLTVVPKKGLQLFYEYGTASSNYTFSCDVKTTAANVPVKTLINSLSPNTRYFYRIRYKDTSAARFEAGDEYTFITQRFKGSTYVFGIIADSHLYDKKGIPSMMKVTMQNLANARPDFVLDLGDTFGDDHQPTTITQAEMMKLHLNFMPYIGMVCHLSHFFFCLGNHEGESGYYLLQTPPDNLAVYGTLARKYYYANPYPDGFYTGNKEVENFGMGYPENYYAWEWGDALFVVLDVYRGYTANDKPQGWDWTIGTDQYYWLKQTLEQSNAKFKFVFTHHLSGQGRGAIKLARSFEWGGYENNGTTWGFTANRPGWPLPIHQLMVNNGVNIFFQGHDHLFAQEMLDGVVYQEVPMPSDSTYMIGMLANADAYTSNQLNGSGNLLVTVSSEEAKVEYVRAFLPHDTSATQHNAEVAFSYSVTPRIAAVQERNVPARAVTLEQNYPNPFNPSTDITFKTTEAGQVTLKVYDVLGRLAATLVDGYRQPGTYTTKFSIPDGSTGRNCSSLVSGVYFYQLKVNETILMKKAIFVK